MESSRCVRSAPPGGPPCRSPLANSSDAQLQAFEDLEDATLRVRHIYPRPDELGCNWSPDIMFDPGSKGSAQYAIPFVDQIVRAAWTLYNVKD